MFAPSPTDGVEQPVELVAHFPRSRFHPCQYAVEVLGNRCSTQASRTRSSGMTWAWAMSASLASSTPAKASKSSRSAYLCGRPKGDWIGHRTARSRSRRAGPLDAQPASRDVGRGATAVQRRTLPSVGGQHWAEALRCRRMVGREARREPAPVMAQTSHRCGMPPPARSSRGR